MWGLVVHIAVGTPSHNEELLEMALAYRRPDLMVVFVLGLLELRFDSKYCL